MPASVPRAIAEPGLALAAGSYVLPMRFVIGPILIFVGIICIASRGDLARAEQASDLPLKELRQGPEMFAFGKLKQVVVGVAFIGFGVAVLAGLVP